MVLKIFCFWAFTCPMTSSAWSQNMPSSFFDGGKTYSPSTSVFEYDWEETYSFEDLDFQDFTLTPSQTKITQTLPVYLTKGKFKTLNVALLFRIENIEAKDTYLNFYLNNNLIQSLQIDPGESALLRFSIPPMPLSVGSYITLEWINPTEKTLSKEAKITIDGSESTISPIFRKDFPLLFSSFPKIMEGKPLQILVDYELSREELQALDDLTFLINKRPKKDYQFYLPEIIRINGPSDVVSRDAHLILITQDPSQYQEILRKESLYLYIEDGPSYKSDELDRFFEKHQDPALTSMELLELNNNRILFIVNDPKAKLSMKEAVDGMEDEIISNTGNILLADDQHYYFFDIRLKELMNQGNPKKAEFEVFWTHYRLYATLILFIGLWLLLRYIHVKSQNAKKSIEDARK